MTRLPLDERARALPQPDAVAPAGHVDVLAPDHAIADDAVGRVLEQHAEQHVVEDDVLNHQALAAAEDAGVLAIERFARAPQREAADCHVRRRDAEHVALALGVQHGTILADQRERLGDAEHPPVDARRHGDHVARSGGVDRLLQVKRLTRSVPAGQHRGGDGELEHQSLHWVTASRLTVGAITPRLAPQAQSPH